jgi:DNA-binding response OmpR family regulator
MHTILLIGSDTAALRALQTVLQEAGFAVAAAAPGRPTLEAVDRGRPDLVVLDLTAPAPAADVRPDAPAGGDPPWPFARRLCQAAGAPVVVLGAETTGEAVLAAFDAGATDYLRRSLPPAELVARVRAVLRRTSAPRTPAPGCAA